MEGTPLDKVWESFATAEDLLDVLERFQELKNKLEIESLTGLRLFEALKLKLGTPKTWKAKELLDLLVKRAKQKEFLGQKAANSVRVLIVGSGPVGLRLAIDASLLGSEVVVIEKRNSFSRHNVLHLWPFTIEDLRQLGAKKFYGKFCAGAIDHISIWRLQSVLLKLSLLLGVRVYPNVEFLEVLEPDGDIGWHASLSPADHSLNGFEFDVLIGGDGARKNRIPGFDRKELRGKLALAITANFKNYGTREEAAVEEISGVAFIFNQKFFKDLRSETGIDLENIVYYKDDTHYFVMTAKKDSLMKKQVLRSDMPDTNQLLHPSNINMEKLYDYSTEAADWSTDLPRLDFATNHHDRPDVALFDFTSIHQAEYAARAIHRGGKDLFICLVGDALLEPFWPTGTGIGRGFLSAMDTAWLIRGLGQGRTTLDLLCEREAIFQRLPQTTPESLQSGIKKYTIDPQTRYPNLNFHRVRPGTIRHLYDVGLSQDSPALRPGSIKVKRTAAAAGISPPETSQSKDSSLTENSTANKENTRPVKKPKEESLTTPKRKPLREKGSISLAYYAEPEENQTLKDPSVLLHWCQEQMKSYDIEVSDLSKSWSNGMALCAIIHRYHPELIDFSKLSPKNSVKNNKLAFSVAEEHLGINSLLKPEEMAKPDKLTLFTYLSLFYELFINAEPAEEVPMDTSPAPQTTPPSSVSESSSRESSPMAEGDSTKRPRRESISKRLSKKLFRRRTSKKLLATSPSSADRSWNTKSIRRPSAPTSPTATSTLAPVSELSKTDQVSTPRSTRVAKTSGQFRPPTTDSSDFCYFCGKRVYLMERMSANGCFFHRTCFRCTHCNCQLKIGAYSLSKGEGGEKGKFFCTAHYRQLFMSNPEAIGYQRADSNRPQEARGSSSEPPETPKTKEPSPPAILEQTPTTPGATPTILQEQPGDDVFMEPSKDDKKKSKNRGRSKTHGFFSDTPDEKQKKKEEKKAKKKESKKKKKSSSDDEKMDTAPPSAGPPVPPVPVIEEPPDSPPRARSASLVKTLSFGFEQLEKHAKQTEIQTGCEGREKSKQLMTRETSAPSLPYKLEVITEDSSGPVPEEKVPLRRTRARSPGMYTRSLSNSRVPAEETLHIPRSSSITPGYSPKKRGRGQRSVTRPLIGNYDTSDVAILERRKQQQRFREAQLIQREMSQLDRQYEELEVFGRQIEEALRDAENTSQEEQFMKSWLNLVNERNGLVRKTTELSAKMKELELEDRQYEVDKELGDLSTADNLTKAELKRFEELCELKVKIVEERNEVVMQTEDERMRELSETDLLANGVSNTDEGYDIIAKDEAHRSRLPSAPDVEANKVEAILAKKKTRKSWFGFGS